MKVAGFTAAGSAIYLAAGEEADLRADLAPLNLVTRVLDGTPFASAVSASAVPFLAQFDADLAEAGLQPATLDPVALA